MAELPIMPVATDALLSDTYDMTAEQFGAYMRLLCTMWRHRGALPDDAGKLSRIAGVSKARWEKIAPAVLKPMTVANGYVTQGKLLEIYAQVIETREKKSSAAYVRWGTQRTSAKSLRKNGAAGTGAYAKHIPTNSNQNHIDKTTTFSVSAKRVGDEAKRLEATPALVALLSKAQGER